MALIEIKNVAHKFHITDDEGNIISENYAIKDIDFTAHKGQIIAIMGKNGSGKSTFARHLNGLLFPDQGSVIISGKATSDEKNLLDIRKNVGMVFQNPDNQIVGNSVSEDIGFGLENIGTETNEIWNRVYEVLELTGMSAYIDRDTSHLSGGQKQRLAIASVMAMRPSCIVFDEATSMLDPKGANEIMELAFSLNKKLGITIIYITHKMDEALHADYIYVMDEGKICYMNTPEKLLNDTAISSVLYNCGIELPLIYRLRSDLAIDANYNDKCDNKDLSDNINIFDNKEIGVINNKSDRNNDVVISAEHISFSYKNCANPVKALNDISFSIKRGEIVAIAGHTGSGKSTVMQMLNGLIRPTEGRLFVSGFDVCKTRNLKELRKRIGYVFQYPEYQLFEDTVLKDVMYGPKNFGMSRNAAETAAAYALKLVGIDDKYYLSSPFELSGGQKKRVALAGILAYKPEILILDEPVAGLDAEGKRILFSIINEFKERENATVILVSHDMNDIYEIADRIIVMNNGSISFDGELDELFANDEIVNKCNLSKPDMFSLKEYLKPEFEISSNRYKDVLARLKNDIACRNKLFSYFSEKSFFDRFGEI